MKRYVYMVVAAACLGVMVPGATGAGASGLKARMVARAPRLAELKQAKAVGEDLKGLVQIADETKVTAADKQLVADENRDRAIVYQIIAKQHGSTPGHVGTQRAAAIYKRAKAGVMLQREDGTWYEKK
ncbi:MAG: DUF1318 domain-containing protein [Lentisphaerae bacterium]|jgi:uncharacterized protein|nr:DUF1318 domain-containing protein [Lentisphaerota bacterium]MBT4818524.1 DUF1318 domain-containing protein [Lentisphaerota bacterium]MBT5606522.1 DUF1318 domain-containing protein [Lentisphaerota bacterium]MBT7060147.1 DUF1318 domain-containing protein [Lentisphaerota bacterium]MBT7845334.1 DUF1318 domain-containing protein [Lentisphaerota bacterium]